MTLDARSPFALRRTIYAAHTLDEVVRAAGDVPQLFVDLMASHLDASALTRVLTLLHDAVTQRVLELAVEKHGEPRSPMPGWPSAAPPAASSTSSPTRTTDWPTTTPRTRRRGLLPAARRRRQRGVAPLRLHLDVHATVASNWQWRLPLSKWCAVFSRALEATTWIVLLVPAWPSTFARSPATCRSHGRSQTSSARRPTWSFMSGLAALGTRSSSALTLCSGCQRISTSRKRLCGRFRT